MSPGWVVVAALAAAAIAFLVVDEVTVRRQDRTREQAVIARRLAFAEHVDDLAPHFTPLHGSCAWCAWMEERGHVPAWIRDLAARVARGEAYAVPFPPRPRR